MPNIYIEEPPSADDVRQQLVVLPDGRYELTDLLDRDVVRYLAATALIVEDRTYAPAPTPQKRTVTFTGESGRLS